MDQETPSLRSMMRRTSLTFKTLLATLLVGVATWGVLDHWQTGHLKALFHDELLHQVWERALDSRVDFERKVLGYQDALSLLAGQQRMDAYLQTPQSRWVGRTTPRIHNATPEWLPEQSLINSLLPVPYLMMTNAKGHALEIYHRITTAPPPKGLLTLDTLNRSLSEEPVMMVEIDTIPYLLFTEPVESAQANRLLVAATPLDDTFMTSHMGASQPSNGIIALATGSPEHIIASNAPQTLLPGTLLKALEREYIIAGKTYINLEGRGTSRTMIEMVSLISSELAEERSQDILITERQQRAITAFVLILASILIMLWVTRTIRRVSLRISEFSQDKLGAPLTQEGSHDELDTLASRFERLMQEVVRTRDNLRGEIEERKRIEAEVTKLSQAVEQSPTALLITDTEGSVLYVNPEFVSLTGYRPDEVIGRNPRMLKSGETARETYRDLWGTLNQGRAWQGVFRNRKKNGKRYWEKNTISPIRDSDGKVINFMSIKEDISARIALEKEIEHARTAAETANQVKSEFLTHMTHEFRTPLNIIKGCVKLIRDENNLSDKQGRQLENILDGATHLATMIQDLVDLSRVESEQFHLHEEPCDLSHLLTELHDEMELKSQEKQLTFAVEVSPTLPPEIMLDAARLRHALTNLLTNAIKFTHEGQVSLNCWYEGETKARTGTLHFVISDTGVGIPSEQIHAIFEPFNQGDMPAMTRGGVGLGLTITKRLVEVMDGTIEVRSEPDHGSVFHIQLPCRKVWRPQEALANSATTTVFDQALLVSHNPVARMILKRILEELGLNTVELDGCQASCGFLENAQAARFGVIIMDCAHQPDGGLSEVRRIRRAETVNATTPIVLLGEPSEDDEVNAKHRATPLPPRVVVLPKPLQRDQVVSAVRNFLNITP
ncbi:PAS/PAC sensor hybrid histidine kinase [Magnetococcus marinus MC-1]|uniref:histidine kinase n=1 Tax=Magnetococcus marinus (strain ATCC BAA-1437 / JCM 17883 / MC-1) TaxID=156889 RepID=A0L621_MAGMM|nr:ATP-binding protein [Magnetococcus marinus]ABK43414.1 PAS/PAC sensor hybrid histidine kinase [Magnetococcus marinus MC-1]